MAVAQQTRESIEEILLKNGKINHSGIEKIKVGASTVEEVLRAVYVEG
ncbi:MAG: hypothetical protein PHT33_08865 [bacterium]|nr:hypothetical protein [bacterium]